MAENLTRHQKFLQIFQEVTRLVSMVQDPQQVMDTIVSSLPELLNVDACSIRLLESSTNTFVMGAAHGLSLEYLSRDVIDTDEVMAQIRSGNPVAHDIGDRDNQGASLSASLEEGIKSVLTLPILFQDSIIGIMRLLTRRQRLFGEEEISFCMALAEQVGIAISNARMFSYLENQVDFMQAVQEITTLANATLKLADVLEVIVQRLPESMEKRGCLVLLTNPQTNRLEQVASFGLSLDYLQQCQRELLQQGGMPTTTEPVAIYDLASQSRFVHTEHMLREGLRALLDVPIRVDGEVIGLLRIFSDEPHCFTSAEVNFAVTVAEAGARAIKNARTYQQINLLFSQIEENERFLANIIDCLYHQLIVVDRHKRVVMVNRVFLAARNISESEALGAAYDLLCREESEEMLPVDQVLATGKSAIFVRQEEVAGRSCWLERTATPMFDAQGRVEFVIEVIRDISSQKQLEREQMERTKLQGVLEMAGTVAHEINTPLFAALGTAQLLEDEIAPEQMPDLEMVVRNLQIISRLTRKMMTMTGFDSREYVGDTRIIDL